MNPLMAAVAQSHAAEVSCPIVRREFFYWQDGQRLLFDGITKFDAPSTGPGSPNGELAIRRKLVDLHQKLFGVAVAVDSPDVDEAYSLFFEVWNRKRDTEGPRFLDSGFQCVNGGDHLYFDGILDDVLTYNENGVSQLESNLVGELNRGADMSDPHHTVRAWVVTLAYLLTDYRYLYF